MSPTAETILREYRDRRLTYVEFERQMRPWLEIDLRGPGLTIRFLQPLNVQVAVAPIHVRRALAAYAANALPESELVLWATMLGMLTEFGPRPGVTDEEADRLDPMWEVITRLTAPTLFGALTPEAIASYEARLQELESELSEDAV